MHNLCFSSFCKICWRFIYWQSTFLMLLFSIGTSFLCFSNRFSVFVCVIVFTCTLKRLFFFSVPHQNRRNEEIKFEYSMGFIFSTIIFFVASCVEGIVQKLYWSCCMLGEKMPWTVSTLPSVKCCTCHSYQQAGVSPHIFQ